jgi:hypothetical protein
MIKREQVAKHVRVKLNSNFEINSISKKHLACEPIIYISDNRIHNDSHGEYVNIRGGSHTNSGTAYLNQLDLEFPIDEKVLYSHEIVDYDQDLSRFKNK